jgi:uncharacterized ferredoxin-like protein
MVVKSSEAELAAVLSGADEMCAAARTAPKACGIDHLDTAVLTGADKDGVAAEMRKIGAELGERGKFFIRDAGNLDAAQAIVLVGAKYKTRGLGKMCGLCGFENCAECERAGALCAFTAMDLGIALGSAVSVAADRRLDNRIMFTIGKAAAALGLLGEHKMIMGIPLSVSGKTPFFDREDI